MIPRELEEDIRQTLGGMADYVEATATPERTDRLWPAGVEVFGTNPMSLAHGAAGPALFLHRVGKRGLAASTMELTLTPKAASKVRGFLEDFAESPDAGLRVSVLPGGCSGFQYGVDIDEAPEGDDEILERSGIRVFVDPFSAQYLEGLEIDYVTSMMGSGFSFRNPQAAAGCGCGSSFTV